MKASFIHLADTHLGNEQYGVRERFNDFSRAYWHILDEAVARQVDFVVIAGDLFHKRAIDALTLIHAIEGLKKLKEHNIPVLAIEGNHDRSYYRDGVSWLQFLCHQGYLILLNPVMRDGTPVLEHWRAGDMLGSYIDLLHGKLRIYGLPWQGASINSTIEHMAQALAAQRPQQEAEGVEYRLLVMHTGIEGQVPHMQGLPSISQFQPLKEHIDYLALGHVHKPYEFEGWIYNPGSTENGGAEEVAWEDRGYYYVEIDTDNADGISDILGAAKFHRAERISNSEHRRPFIRHEIQVDELATPELLYAKLEDYCKREYNSARGHSLSPMVQIHLFGTLPFDAGSLDFGRMEKMVSHYFQPLHVKIENHTNDQDYIPQSGELDGRDRSVWHSLERRIFEDLVSRDNRYLATKEQWSIVLAELKEQALQKEDPLKIAQFLREKRATLLES